MLARRLGRAVIDQFRDFTFANAVRFWTSPNLKFFKGTAVENEAAKVLAA